jgi:hypothetical protein
MVVNTAMKNPRVGVRLNTSSKRLMESMRTLCYKLGMGFSVTTVPPRGHSREAYIIAISSPDMYANLDKLVCVGSDELHKIAQWKELKVSSQHGQHDMIPISCPEAALLKDIWYSCDRSAYAALSNKNAKQAALSRDLIMRNIQKLTSEKGLEGLVRRVNDTNTIWGNIDKLSDAGNRLVFDLEVEGTKVFCVNEGVIIWDTMTLHVPATDDAVKDVIEKMMPERNLLAARDFKPLMPPTQDYIMGAWAATKNPAKGDAKVFETEAEALMAYKRGELDMDTPVIIKDRMKNTAKAG